MINLNFQVIIMNIENYFLKSRSVILIIRMILFKFLKFITKENYIHRYSKKNKIGFSFLPGKSNRWHFSSPTRLVNALNNCELPIVFKNINDVSRYLCIYIKKLNKNNINYLIKYKKS